MINLTIAVGATRGLTAILPPTWKRRRWKIALPTVTASFLLRPVLSCTTFILVPERGGDGSSSTDLVKRGNHGLQPSQPNGDSGISTELTLERAGQKFKVAAVGLWGAGTAVVAAMIAIQAWVPAAHPMMWLLGVVAGGILATGTMHGRLADNRFELARVRRDLDRKSAEYSRLQAQILRNPQSSRGKKRGKNKSKDADKEDR